MAQQPTIGVFDGPVDNFFATSSRGMADSFDKAAKAGADLSQLRVGEVGPLGAWVKHLPSPRFSFAEDGLSPSSHPVFVLCGCAYLSASFWPETIAAARGALESHGVGSYDSAPLSGETRYHEDVKDELLKIYRPSGGGSAFLTVSASMANITAIPMLVGRGDMVFADVESHMTLTQGLTTSQARVIRFLHNDMDDLERKLAEADRVDPACQHRRLIVTDGIFSMSGHVCNLPELLDLAERYRCRLLVDEAHALGALGPTGRGTAEYWNVDPSRIHVITGTLAKAVGAQGGYIVCHGDLGASAGYEYTTNRVFSSGIPASTAAAAAEVLRQMNAVHGPKELVSSDSRFSVMYRRQIENAGILKRYLRMLKNDGLEVDPDSAPGTVQRIVIGDEDVLFDIQRELYKRGAYVLGIVFPAVPEGRDQLRLTVMPSISKSDMESCGEAIVDVCRAALKKRGNIAVSRERHTKTQALFFHGQGSQFPGMGKEVFAAYPQRVREASDILGYAIDTLCLEDPLQQLRRTEYAQPALFVVNALNYCLWRDRYPDAHVDIMAGHSLGEFCALFAAGSFDFETGVRLVQRRGQLMSEAPDGGMVAVLGIQVDRLRELLRSDGLDSVDIANVNSPTQTVIAGDLASLAAAGKVLTSHGAKCISIDVSGPFHSRHMRTAQREFASFLQGTDFRDPLVPVVSNVTARSYPPGQVADLLAQQIASPVRWMESIRYLMSSGDFDYTEFGGSTLGKLVEEVRRSDLPGPHVDVRASTTNTNPSAASFIIREPVDADLLRLVELDRASQPDAMRTPVEELRRRVSQYPRGQRVIESDGRIVGALYGQRIESPEILRDTCFADVGRFHVPTGRHMQLLGLYVDPEWRGRGVSDVLIDAMLAHAETLDEVDSVVAVTRCANFVDHKTTSGMESYVNRRNEVGQPFDPMLHFHVSRGARILEVLTGFRPDDIDNDGAGVLIEYSLHVASARAAGMVAAVDTLAAPKADIARTIRTAVEKVLGPDRTGAFGEHVPFMEMGLSSLELLEVRRLLSARMHLDLPSTFLFSYGTPAAIAGYFSQVATSAEAVEPSVRTPSTSGNRGKESDGPIAIIGMACRFPGGAHTPERFWRNLQDGWDAVGPLPSYREALRGSHDAPFRWRGGYLDNVDCFDAAFFRISPREAAQIDPQQRLLLEVAWEALESACISPLSLRGTQSGVFVGMMGAEYGGLVAGQSGEMDVDGHYATGNSPAVAAGRIAYFFDWQGPALCIDTACSSSLVALHEACRSLQHGDCDTALAAGVNLLLDDRRFIAFERAGMLSPEGRCKTFDASADGYVRGEGCAAVILKRLHDAQADHDPILAVIRGSAINQDGSSSGLTAPNPQAQQAVIARALAQANMVPHDIDYLEAHGTGTALGDPIEVVAAAHVLGQGRAADRPLLIGSVKSAIGHLEGAAGIAGLIKTVLALRNEVIPGQPRLEKLNPHIPWETLPVQVVTTTTPWPVGVRRAGVSSFGFSGTNAHVVLEAYEEVGASSDVPGEQVVIVLSARNEERLRAQVERLATHLKEHTVDLRELAYTLQVGREAWSSRCGFLAGSLREVVDTLDAYLQDRVDGIEVRRGQTSKDSFGVDVRLDEDLEQTIGAWLAKRKLDPLLDGWVRGWSVDWSRLYGETKPRRIPLPTYAFAQEHHWFKGADENVRAEPSRLPQHGQPFVLRHTDDASGLRYSTTLTGEEDFLRGHVVRDERVVPGVVQLEWARAAVALALGIQSSLDLVLTDVTWIRPLVVRSACEIHIRLQVRDNGRVSYEIHGDDEAMLYGRGSADRVEASEAPRLDLATVRSQCTTSWNGEACYERFAQAGLHYGASFQVMKELARGAHVALGALRAADDRPGADQWPPDLLDGAVQAGVWMALDDGLALPFTLGHIRAWDTIPEEAWVVVRPSAASADPVPCYDIDIADANGRVVLRMEALSIRKSSGIQRVDAGVPRIAASSPLLSGDAATGDPAAENLQGRIEDALTDLISKQLMLARKELDRHMPMTEFGFDSIGFAEFADELDEIYGLDLNPAVFFKHPTIAALAAYLSLEHAKTMAALF